RGTDGRAYPWGDALPTAETCIWGYHPKYGLKSTAPVGSCPGGASPYGALDMAGNVSQRCAGGVTCGGGYRHAAGACTCASRDRRPFREIGAEDIGFRPARNVE